MVGVAIGNRSSVGVPTGILPMICSFAFVGRRWCVVRLAWGRTSFRTRVQRTDRLMLGVGRPRRWCCVRSVDGAAYTRKCQRNPDDRWTQVDLGEGISCHVASDQAPPRRRGVTADSQASPWGPRVRRSRRRFGGGALEDRRPARSVIRGSQPPTVHKDLRSGDRAQASPRLRWNTGVAARSSTASPVRIPRKTEAAAGRPRVGHSWPRPGPGGGGLDAGGGPFLDGAIPEGGFPEGGLPEGGFPEGGPPDGALPGAPFLAEAGLDDTSTMGNWMSSLDEAGCRAGVNLAETGGADTSNPTVGSGGGYGGFYCFALTR
jgi:hypothetical protein